ncbi:hypothetical protein HOY80DRAFT_1072020 [Tuber brumale]|nr:hypothetical protein HOY80DRAFT_1072020 [Tuber brumale]
MTLRFTNDPRIGQGPTTENLLRENQFVRGRLQRVEEELRQANIRLGVNRVWKNEEEEEEARLNPWRMPSPEEERSPREASKKHMSGSLEEMVAQVADGGKRRRVGGAFDPENFEGNRVPFMVKIGGVRWEEGIGGVEVALCEAGVGFCDGTRWLVGEEELNKRRERGSLASMVVVKIRGLEAVGVLCWSGLWVGGYWCSVRRFVAVQLKQRIAAWEGVMERVGEKVMGLARGLEERKRKEKEEEWVGGDRLEKVLEALKGLGDRLRVVEGGVKGVAKGVWKAGLSTEERLGEKEEEYMRRVRLREEEEEMEKEMDDAADEFFKASKEEFKRGRMEKAGVDFSVKPTGPSGVSFGRAQGDTSFVGRGGNLFDVWKKGS